MRFAKFLVALLVISIFFTSCNKKKEGTEGETKGEIVKHEVTKSASSVTAAQIKALSDVLMAGDVLVKEKNGYNKEISELSRSFKNLKTPFLFKKGSKFKHVKISYSFSTVWVYVYSNADKKDADKLFWITINYKDNMTDTRRKRYNEKFAGLNTKHFKDAWVWALLKGDIEIQVSASGKTTKNDKAMEEVLKEFDIKAIETIFTAKTPYPKLKEYFLKMKVLNAKVRVVNDKFKAMEKDAIAAFEPFLNREGFLKDYTLSKIYYSTSNTFSLYVKKDKKNLATVYVGRADLIGALSYFRSKTVKNFKTEGFDSTSYKNNLVIVKLPKVAVKVTSYSKDPFTTAENLKKVAASILLKELAKIK